MNMNILEQEDLIKGATDDILLREAQSPTGSVPQFLVVSEIQRRKEMRNRFSTQDGQPEQSVADQIVAEATPQMPSEMMVPQNDPMAPQPQMMAAGGGRMPYRRMAGGGIVPPNSLVEDAAKFNPQNLYDMDASQMAMASPTNMGIASVLPMAGGGVVRMDEGGGIQAIKDMAYEHYYGDDDKFNYGTALLDAASFIPVGGAAALGGRAIYRGGKILLPKLAKYLKSGVLQKKLKSGLGSLKEGTQRFVNPKTSPLTTREVLVQGPAIKGGVPPSSFRELSPKRILGTTAAYEGILNLPRLLNKEEVSGEIKTPTNAIEQNTIRLVDNNNQQDPLNEANTFLEARGYASGGIIRMQTQGQVPSNFVSINDTATRLASYYEDNPNEIVTPEHLGIIVGQQSPDFVSELTSENAAKKMFGNQLFNAAPNSNLDNKSLNNDKATSLTVEDAMDIGREQGNLGLTDYEISEQIRNLDTSNQTNALKDRIQSLEEMKGRTPDTFDITESVLRSGERADKRAMSQALINLGAGIAAGDVSKGLKDAGTAVSDVRQRQEEFQQLAEIRKAEAESKAGSDMMTRDIGIISSQINALGDINEQDRASSELLLTREQRVIDATNSKNANLIAQATNDLNIAKYATTINQFDRKLKADIERETDLNRRAALTYYSAQLRVLAPELIAKDSQLSREGKQTWKTSFIEDDGRGWSVNRALNDLMAQIEAQMPFTGSQDPFDGSPTGRRKMINLP